METLTITKLDAARRQLETAVFLFFNDGDAVSIHTLTCAAYNVVRDVNNHRGGPQMLAKQRYLQMPGKPTLAAMNEPENFFKHADRDPDASFDFVADYTECLLVDACRTYADLTGERVIAFDCFLLWFMCRDQSQFDIAESVRPFADEAQRLFKAGDRQGFYQCCLALVPK